MKKRMGLLLLVLCLPLVLTACFGGMPVPGGNDDVGNDWHVWGLYDFVTVADVDIAVGKAYDDQSRQVGYNIYADGSSQGPQLGALRCADGGYGPEDLDAEGWLLLEDYDGDGATDMGMPMKNGDVLWYVKGEDQYGGTEFVFAGTIPAG